MIELNLELEIHENLNEAFWKVDIPDLPPMFIEAGSAGQIKTDMRKKLKSSLMDDISIERVSKTEMIKKFRELSQGKDIDEVAPLLARGMIVKALAKKAAKTAVKKYDPVTKEEVMSTASDVDMNPTGKPKKKKCETFNVSDDCFHKFRHGKTKFERWSKYLDLTDGSQKKIYDWARRHHNGTIILKNSVTGAIRGIRYNRTGGGKWGSITRLKEQVLETNKKFTVK